MKLSKLIAITVVCVVIMVSITIFGGIAIYNIIKDDFVEATTVTATEVVTTVEEVAVTKVEEVAVISELDQKFIDDSFELVELYIACMTTQEVDDFSDLSSAIELYMDKYQHNDFEYQLYASLFSADVLEADYVLLEYAMGETSMEEVTRTNENMMDTLGKLVEKVEANE